MVAVMKFLPVAVQALGVLLGLLYAFSLFVNAVQRVVPPAWMTYVEQHAPRVAWLARATRKIGGDAIPALQALYKALAGHPYQLGDARVAGPGVPPRGRSGFVSRRPMTILAIVFLVGIPLSIVLHGCAGSTTNVGATSTITTSPGGDVSWTAGVNVAVSIARAAIPAAKAAFDASPSVRPDARATGDRVFQSAIDALPLASTALDTFTHAPTTQSKCRVHFYTEQALTAGLQAVTIARDAGAQLPAELPAALGGLAAIDDALFPGCGISAPPARRISAQERVHAVFGAHL